MKRFCTLLMTGMFLLVLVVSISHAEEWKKVTDLSQENMKMNKGGASYDNKTARFYKRTPIAFKNSQTLTMKVTSYDYQPVIIIRDKNGKIIARGKTKSKRRLDADGNVILDKNGKPAMEMWCELEFSPPEDGTYFVDNTTEGISQGVCTVVGAVWGAKKELKDSDAGPVSDFPMNYGGYKRSKKVYNQNRKGIHIKGAKFFPASGKSFIEIEIAWIEPGDETAQFTGSFQKIPDNKYTQPIVGQSGNVFFRQVNKAGYQGVLIISDNKEARAQFMIKVGEEPLTSKTRKKFIDLAKSLLAEAEGHAIPKRE